jgi:acetyl esterase/lipase
VTTIGKAGAEPGIAYELRGQGWDALVEDCERSRGMGLAEFVARARSATPSVPDLTADGRLTVEEIAVPCAGDTAVLPGVVLRPTGQSGGLSCVYVVAGGRLRQSPYLSLSVHDAEMAAELGVVLVSIAPRVGPEHPHPAQVEDAHAGLEWTVAHADQLGIAPDRLVLLGKGGGGGVAAALALLARDRGGPFIGGQLLVAPMLDDRGTTPSAALEIAPWPSWNNRLAWSAVLGETVGTAGVSPYAAAARAEDLRGLPPTYLEVGGSEVMRDEVVRFAGRLVEQGVPTELHMWVGAFHAFDAYVPDAEVSRACRAVRTSYLRRRLVELTG